MDILHLDSDDINNPLTGGGAKKNFEIYRRLSEKHNITVLTATYPGSKREVIREGIRYISLGSGNPRLGLSYHFSYLASLPFAIREFKHDVLVEDFMAPCGGVGSFLWTKKPVVSSIQWFFAFEWYRKYKIPFHLLQNRWLTVYKNFMVQSKFMEGKIKERNQCAKITIIPPGINKEYLDSPVSRGEYILFFGRIDIKQKGIDILLRSYCKALKSNALPRLVIAGDGNDMPELKRMICRLGLSSNVDLVGKISNDDKPHWFSNAKFVCMPSRFETFGMVALEAFAFGKSVLCFNIPALNELVDSSRGFAVEAFNEKEYANKMLLMVLNEGDIFSRNNICRQFAQKFVWENIALKQEEFLSGCLKKGD